VYSISSNSAVLHHGTKIETSDMSFHTIRTYEATISGHDFLGALLLSVDYTY